MNRSERVRAPRGVWALAAVPAIFIAVFFVYPVATIIGRGLLPAGRPELGGLTDVLTDPGLRGVVWFTFWQAALSTIVTVLVGLPGAFVLARYRFFGQRALHAAIIVPFVLPTLVVGAAFRSLLGAGGPLAGLDLDGTVCAIVLAHVFFNYAVVVRVVGGLWAHLDPRDEDAARVLGASRFRAFASVTLPALRPAIVAAASIVFLFTFTSFGVILILGSPEHATLEVEIYRQTAELLDLRQAAALSTVQLVAVLAVLGLSAGAQRRWSTSLRLLPAAQAARRPRSGHERALVGVNLAVMGGLLGVPLVVLVERALSTGDGYGLASFRALSELRRGSTLFVPPTEAIASSLRFAAVATVIALGVGGLAAFALSRTADPRRSTPRANRSRRAAVGLDALLMLPLGVSAVTVGFGFLVALDQPPLDLRGDSRLVPIAHALVAVPFVVRTMTPVLRSIDPRLREAAAVLGASPARVWAAIDLPMAVRAGFVAAGFAFAVSLGEFGATLFIARPDEPTLPIVIFRLLGQPGPASFGAAMAASTILMALTAIAIFAIERVGSPNLVPAGASR